MQRAHVEGSHPLASELGLVDISHVIETGMPIYPGDPEVSIRPWTTVSDDGYAVLQLHIGSQSGTHLDAPSHFLANGEAVEDIDLNRLIGPAVVIDCRGLPPNGEIGSEPFERSDIAGRAVLIHTGWDVHWGSETYVQHPALSEEAATILRDQQVRVVGIDALSVDLSSRLDHGFPAHAILLGASIPIAENLRGLEHITWPDPVVSMLPLRLRAGDGAPIRAVAWSGSHNFSDPWPLR